MKSVMQHQFSQVPRAEIQRSRFDRSHGLKTTFDAGYLVPIFVDEVLPSDTFNLDMQAFTRLSTPVAPIMDNIMIDTFFFFVPNRLLWNNWEKFNGAQDNPSDSTDYLIPTISAPSGGYASGSLSDYFGIPTGIDDLEHNSLFHRAYNLIYNEWFRDQNLQDSVTVDLDDGPDSDTDYVLLRRGKRHDYFTSCLPWPQKGAEVNLPLGDVAPVIGIGVLEQTYPNTVGSFYETDATGTRTYASFVHSSATNNSNQFAVEEDPNNAGFPNIRADLTAATAASINDLREAFQIQRLFERDARGGTRYTEIIKSHFGAVSPDFRLQRPEYLGGSSTPVVITPIAQTSATDAAVTPQGNLAAMGTATPRAGFTKSFTEHGVVIGLVSVRADLTYQQGLNRMFSRQSRFDFYWPALAHLGEQAVLNKEIYAQGSSVDTGSTGTPDDDRVFGYQERYAEYRYKPSQVTGDFRSASATNFDIWHLSQDFSALPVLNASFIEENPPIDRVVAVNTEPQFIFDSFFRLQCARPMPMYSVPGLIDHF